MGKEDRVKERGESGLGEGEEDLVKDRGEGEGGIRDWC